MKKNVEPIKSKTNSKETTNENNQDTRPRDLAESQISDTESKPEMSDQEPTVVAPRSGSRFLKRDKVSDILPKQLSIDSKNSPTKTSLKFLKIISNEETHENKWKKFWVHHRDKFRHKSEEDFTTKNRTFEEMTAEVDAVFRKAIRSMRFDRSDTDRRFCNIDESSPEKNAGQDDNKNTESISELSQAVEAPPRRLRLSTSRIKDRKFMDVLAGEQGTFKKKTEKNDPTFIISGVNEEKQKENTFKANSEISDINFLVGISDEEKDVRLENKIRSDRSTRRWSSLENLVRKAENVGEGSSTNRIEGLSIERPVRSKEKRTIGSLRSSLERKMGSVERILEDQIEKIWEEKVEKHPWLLPIESWIVERCRPSGTYSIVHDRKNSGLKMEEGRLSEKEQHFDFKFTAPEKKDEEGRIEIKLEHLKRSERSERSGFETANLISRLRKSSSEHSKVEEQEVLDAKDVKHHDLFDKLKGNVREKMEDIHRVDWSIFFLINFTREICLYIYIVDY